jgi:hypothetical protein
VAPLLHDPRACCVADALVRHPAKLTIAFVVANHSSIVVAASHSCVAKAVA